MNSLLIIVLGAGLLLNTNADPLPGLLYPRESEFREVKSLDGLWNFVVSPAGGNIKSTNLSSYGNVFSNAESIIQMPVPSSYNDITTSRELRDHVGVVWYERTFFVPQSWSKERVFVYFGSVNYLAHVWVNGQFSTSHEVGHLPFQAEITSFLKFGSENRLTVAVDNTLSATTIPQGKIEKDVNNGHTTYVQVFTFDFFNYAGIHRSVLLHTKPRVYVEDITVRNYLEGDDALLEYFVIIAGRSKDDEVDCSVSMVESDKKTLVADGIKGCKGNITVTKPHLWWPRGMDNNPGYLYTLQVSVVSVDSTVLDTYRLSVGIRNLKLSGDGFFINENPIYFRGFGRHEDSPIRGRGFDLVTMTRDFELLKWIGANSFRTSHYPYSDEVLEMADRDGFLIISECPAGDLDDYSAELLRKHKNVMFELIRRDKNRPSVVMWSIANEPKSAKTGGSQNHFAQVSKYTKNLDPSRPITAALSSSSGTEYVSSSLDVIGFNRYTGWYSKPGRIENIFHKVVNEVHTWNQQNKPVIMFEYGGDTLAGNHELPSSVWSEEYQIDMLSEHFKAFDHLRAEQNNRPNIFLGEFIWNFADFRTVQGVTRVGGNKKGIFTRTRDPKMAAYIVRKRYHNLAATKSADYSSSPKDLYPYFIATEKFIDCPAGR